MKLHRASIPFLALLAAIAPACASGNETSESSASQSTSGGDTTTSGGGNTSGTGGAGTGGATAGTGGETTSGTGGAGTGGSGGQSAGAAHVLIAEVSVGPQEGEFIEIWNPTDLPVNLSDYYLSDNSAYYGIAKGDPWSPVGTAGTDFLARFPAGTTLAPDGVIVIATDDGFPIQYGGNCPDFILAASGFSCGGKTVPPMLAPANGGIGENMGTLVSNDREMVVLFQWSGVVGQPLKDVDYVTWGAMFEDATRVDKSGIAPYAADTPRASQKSAPAPVIPGSIGRCSASEPGEKATGGNGLAGHDETSEDLGASFSAQAMPSPGAKNGCIQ